MYLFVPTELSLDIVSKCLRDGAPFIMFFFLTMLKVGKRHTPDQMFISFYSGGKLAVVELWLILPFITSVDYKAQISFSLFQYENKSQKPPW